MKFFILSQQEYELLAEQIPKGPWCWTRSKGTDPNSVCFVDCDNILDIEGVRPSINYGGVRPAFYSKTLAEMITKQNSSIVLSDYNIWCYLGNNLFISKYVVCTSKFDKKSCDYKDSILRNQVLPQLEKQLCTPQQLAMIDDVDI